MKTLSRKDSSIKSSSNFTIAPGGFEATKGDATVGWTVGEKVFVFFQPDGEELISGGYVEFAYKEDGSWDSVYTLPDGSLGSAGKMAAGLVCLPFAGERVNNPYLYSYEGYCWSSSNTDDKFARVVHFSSNQLLNKTSLNKAIGASVRLVTDVPESL